MLSNLTPSTRYKLECLSVVRCINYISYIFDAGEHAVYLHTNVSTRVNDILRNIPESSQALAASVGPIQFIGGPPGKRDYCQGSLLTILEDLILLSVYGCQPQRLKKLEEALALVT